ncbi:hypothetical protein HY065_00315 [Candidatus Berkelbacteria bacterium]|nr:hypothetical protein [Candidatus Berkelbacteria bacterium]
MARKKTFSRLFLIVSGAIILLAVGLFAVFVNSQRAEPQDVMLRGNADTTEHYLDGKLVGKGLLVCVSKVSQGKHTIEQRSAGQTRKVIVQVGDVGIQILDTSGTPADDVVFLSNCASQPR